MDIDFKKYLGLAIEKDCQSGMEWLSNVVTCTKEDYESMINTILLSEVSGEGVDLGDGWVAFVSGTNDSWLSYNMDAKEAYFFCLHEASRVK